MLWPLRYGIALFNKRHHFTLDEFGITFALRIHNPGISRNVRNVFARAISRVVDADNNQWADLLLGNEAGCCLANLPMHSSKRCRRIKQILPVIQIEHWIASLAPTVIIGRKPNSQQSSVSKNFATKFMQPQLARSTRHLDRRRCFYFRFSRFREGHEEIDRSRMLCRNTLDLLSIA